MQEVHVGIEALSSEKSMIFPQMTKIELLEQTLCTRITLHHNLTYIL